MDGGAETSAVAEFAETGHTWAAAGKDTGSKTGIRGSSTLEDLGITRT